MTIGARGKLCLVAVIAVMSVGCGDDAARGSHSRRATEPPSHRATEPPSHRATEAITIPGDGHEVNLYRAATDGEALWLTDEMVPVLYRYDLETGSVTETRLNDFDAWTPTGNQVISVSLLGEARSGCPTRARAAGRRRLQGHEGDG